MREKVFSKFKVATIYFPEENFTLCGIPVFIALLYTFLKKNSFNVVKYAHCLTVFLFVYPKVFQRKFVKCLCIYSTYYISPVL